MCGGKSHLTNPSTAPSPTGLSRSWPGRAAVWRRAGFNLTDVATSEARRPGQTKRPADWNRRGVSFMGQRVLAALHRPQDEEQDQRTDDGSDEAADAPAEGERTAADEREDQSADEGADDPDDDIAEPP